MNKLTDENVHLTDLWKFTGVAREIGPLRSIHSHDGGIRSAAFGVRHEKGAEALRQYRIKGSEPETTSVTEWDSQWVKP